MSATHADEASKMETAESEANKMIPLASWICLLTLSNITPSQLDRSILELIAGEMD